MKQQLHRIGTMSMICIFLHTALLAGGAYGNYYVKSTASGSGDGSSWTNAFTNLQVAIDIAVKGDIICVAAGTYFPTHRHLGDSLRHSTFYISKDVIILGGFSGEPGTEGSMEGRDPSVHVTILSGDLGTLNNTIDNAFHVVYIDHVSDTMRLDGFIVEKGNSLNAGGFDAIGAGIFNNADGGRSHPTIANCIIRDNEAPETGGGLYLHAPNGGLANSLLTNCIFLHNKASGGGGVAVYSDSDGNASPTFLGCTFMGNSGPTAGGGAITIIGHSATVSPRMINCVFTGNHSPTSSAVSAFVTTTGVSRPEFINCAFSGNSGGSVRVSNIGTGSCALIGRNSIFWNTSSSAGVSTGNADIDLAFCIVPFGFSGEGNVGLDPLFVNQPPADSAHTLGDLHVLVGSPAFDAGRNSDVPVGVITDLDGKPRFINGSNGQVGTVDIGPYEFQGPTTGVRNFISTTDWNVYPNPAQDNLEITIGQNVEEGSVNLLDAKGRLISNHQLENGTHQQFLDISALPSGTYFVHLLLSNGQDVKKVVVE